MNCGTFLWISIVPTLFFHVCCSTCVFSNNKKMTDTTTDEQVYLNEKGESIDLEEFRILEAHWSCVLLKSWASESQRMKEFQAWVGRYTYPVLKRVFEAALREGHTAVWTMEERRMIRAHKDVYINFLEYLECERCGTGHHRTLVGYWNCKDHLMGEYVEFTRKIVEFLVSASFFPSLLDCPCSLSLTKFLPSFAFPSFPPLHSFLLSHD